MKLLKTLLLAGLAAPMLASAATNLVTNGDFETTTFSGWTIGGYTTITSDYGVDCTDGIQYAGNCAAYFGEPKATTATQTLTVAASTQYLITFMMSQAFGGTPSTQYPNSFSVAFNGTTLGSGTNLADSSAPSEENPVYTAYSYMATTAATGNTGSLVFSFLDTSGMFLLDDVSVVAVPTAAVPETSTPLLMGAGLLALGIAARRKRK